MSLTVTGATGTASATTQGTATNNGDSNPLASLAGNFQDFLSLLTTQLQNQDPSAPMDSNQFTTELVQFAGVAQQITTNTNLSQLIQLAQGSTMIQSAQLVGKQVEVNADELTLQNGSAGLVFTAPAPGPVTITVYGSAGQPLYTATVNAQQGANTWSWNGQTASGTSLPDGAYKVTVASAGSTGAANALPFAVIGRVTGVQQSNGAVTLQLGQLSVGIAALASTGT